MSLSFASQHRSTAFRQTPGADGFRSAAGSICLLSGLDIHLQESRFRPDCYNGDILEVCSDLTGFRTTHSDHHIRLCIEDGSCISRWSSLMHSPNAFKTNAH